MSHPSESTGPSVPAEAKSNAGINASTPTSEREPSRVPEDKRKLNNGPKKDEETGAYLPSVYKIREGAYRTDR